MRIGVSSRGTSWISMGPIGWLIFYLIVAPIVTLWRLLIVIACVLAWLLGGLIGLVRGIWKLVNERIESGRTREG